MKPLMPNKCKVVTLSKVALGANEMHGILITNLYKGFSCFPHRLLIANLKAYGLDESAWELLSSYFTKRMQVRKYPGSRSDWRVRNTSRFHFRTIYI